MRFLPRRICYAEVGAIRVELWERSSRPPFRLEIYEPGRVVKMEPIDTLSEELARKAFERRVEEMAS